MSNDLVSIFPGRPKNTISRKKPQKSKKPRKVSFPNDFFCLTARGNQELNCHLYLPILIWQIILEVVIESWFFFLFDIGPGPMRFNQQGLQCLHWVKQLRGVTRHGNLACRPIASSQIPATKGGTKQWPRKQFCRDVAGGSEGTRCRRPRHRSSGSRLRRLESSFGNLFPGRPKK